MIEDILPFVLNTKRPLCDIWLLRYKQNSFGCFKKKLTFRILLYSKPMAGHPVSPHIETIAISYLQGE